MARLAIDERYIEKNEQAIREGKPVVVQVRDEGLMAWQNVRAILSPQPLAGGETLNILDLHGAVKGQWHIQVLEEADEVPVQVEEGTGY